MFIKHLLIGLRNLRRQKSFTLINVLGLTVGITAVLLIFRIVYYELGFNKNFKHYDRIVRVVTAENNPEEGESQSCCIPIPAMEAIRSSVPQFEEMVRIREVWPAIAVPNPGSRAPLKKFETEGVCFFAEPSFFKIFNLEWLAGDPATALSDPNTTVLSKSVAEKCFGSAAQAMGKTVLLDNQVTVSVRGVVNDLPAQCNFPIDALFSYPTLKPNRHLYFYDEEWGSCSSNNQVYALLRKRDDWNAAAAALANVGKKEYNERGPQFSKQHRLQAFADLHYDDRFGISGGHIITKNRLWVLTSIGILILALACFNFINLATVQASMRAKEVGVRKTLGVSRGHLVGQFMSETGLVVAVSVLAGGLLAAGSAPLLKYISDVPDETPFFSDPALWVFLAATGLTVTLLAGLYPASVLAAYSPVQALKSNVRTGIVGGGFLRKSLVIAQFFIAQALIVGAIVIVQQINYIESRDLGFKKDLVYTFSILGDSATAVRQTSLKQGLLQIPSVQSVSFCNDQPASSNTWNTNFRYGATGEDAAFSTSLKFCDADYQKTYGLRLLAGRWLEPSDTIREAVVNETLLRKVGVTNPNAAIGQSMRLGRRRMMDIVGVVKDFHDHSLHDTHSPIVLTTRKELYFQAGIKIRPDNIEATTAAIQKVFDEVLPEQVFSGQFLDEQVANFYVSEQRFSAMTKGFGLLAIFISCLGLFGLAAHSVAQRTREIGIRKVLGASVGGILELMSRDFLKLVLIALALAIPASWWAMNHWLADFAFRIQIGWQVFAVTGTVAIAVALLTVGSQALRAALANPAKSLKEL